MGLAAAGVMGIKPGDHDDKVVGLEVVKPRAEVLLLTDQGMGKRTELKEYPTQGRYGVGVTAADLAGKQKLVGFAVGAAADRALAVTSKDAVRVIKFDAVGRKKRPARGAGVVPLKAGETVVRVVPLLEAFEAPEMAPAAKPAARASAQKKAAAQPALLEAPARKPARGKRAGKK